VDTLEKLIAIEDIRNLKGRYFRTLDTKQWSAWEQCFVPDLVTEFPDDRPDMPPFKGRRTFVQAIEEALGPAVTIHHGHTPEIEILSPTTAKGLWVMQDWLHWSAKDPQPLVGVCNVLGWGHYHETYTKTSEGWRIATLKLTRTKLERF